MLRKITVLCILFSFIPLLVFGQNKALLKPNGKLEFSKKTSDVVTLKKIGITKVKNYQSLSKTNGQIDTLTYDNGRTNGFIMDAQDILVQWFQASADLDIVSVGVVFEDNSYSITGEVKIVKCNWTKDQIMNAGVNWYGYYPADGNGFNNRTAFLDNQDRTGDWVAASSAPISEPPFVEDLWSDASYGKSFVPDTMDQYYWINMDELGFRPQLKQGEIFGVVLKNDYPNLGVASEDQLISYGDNTIGVPGFKYYCGGRLVTDVTDPGFDGGWWSREYTWDMVAVVELTGDQAPVISDVYKLKGTLSTGPIEITATITDENPSGGAVGVASAVIQYKVDDAADWSEAAMSLQSGDTYAGNIPGQAAGSTVTYRVKATDVNGFSSTSDYVGAYLIFKPSNNVNTLVVFNGLGYTAGAGDYPQEYYFGVGDFSHYTTRFFDHDVWGYGPLTADLVNHYTNIVEIATPSPDDYNDDVIKTWLEGSGSRNYALCGQEWLGARYSYNDLDFAAGSFEYDILGITHSYNDVSYDGTTASYQISSRIFAQQGSLLADSIYVHFTAGGTDSLCYDPYYELGTAFTNWIDAFDVVAGQDVDVLTETRGIGGTATVEQLPCATHRTLAAGNRIAFLSFDPLSVNSAPAYHWYGFESYSIQNNILTWFGVTSVGVETKKDGIPTKFELTQNYPNPFNPTTKISFSVPERSDVSLKIYDMLGREVRSLINGSREAGNYEVSFEASDLSTGLYIYTLTAGNFTATKKMMLLK